MPSYLLFRLFGPMAAWGDIAVGERRHVFPQPTKSAVLGLVAGALGLRRTDEASLAAIHAGYGWASRVDSAGLLLTDFHTAQTPPESAVKRAKGFRTRRDELAIRRSELETTLSYRDYRVDALAVACLWSLDAAPYPLEQLSSALLRPAFIPYLGRRSCSPSLPFAPQVMEGASPIAVLRSATFPDDDLLSGITGDRARNYYWEGEILKDIAAFETIQRRDVARSRIQWQFSDRSEYHAVEERSHVSQQD